MSPDVNNYRDIHMLHEAITDTKIGVQLAKTCKLHLENAEEDDLRELYKKITGKYHVVSER